MLQFKKLSCYLSGCQKLPNLACKCKNPAVYSCMKHIQQHTISTKDNHVMVFIPRTVVEEKNKQKILTKLNTILLDLVEIKTQSSRVCSEIISSANGSLKKLFGQLNSIRKLIFDAKANILSNTPIEDKLVTTIFEHEQLSFETDHRENFEKLSELFSLRSLTKTISNEEYALYSIEWANELKTINLETFKSSTFPSAKKYWYQSGACKIGDNKYFINGGCTKQSEFGHTSIINLNTNTETILPESSIKKHAPGCICKDQKVYVFGGFSNSPVISAELFDLQTNEWSTLPNLPIASQLSATLINNKIVISGHYLTCAYIYDNNLYTQNLALPSKIDHIGCDKWLFSPNALYECFNLDTIKWRKYEINNGRWPAIFIAHMKGQYIYYIEENYCLWRIDTLSKTSIKVSYS